MSRALQVLIAVGMLTATASTLAAQAASTTLVPGRRVRVEIAGSAKFVGNVARIGQDTIGLVGDAGDTVWVARKSISRLDVYMGEGHNVGRAAARGTAIGAGVGLVLGIIAVAGQSEGDFLYTPPGQLIASGLLGGAVWGLGIGTVVGLIAKSPKWSQVPVATLKVTPAGPDGAGVALGFSMRF